MEPVEGVCGEEGGLTDSGCPKIGDPQVGGVGWRKHRAAGEVEAPVQVSGSPSSLTNFEIDL